MSRLIDELKKADRTSNQPMGFKASRQSAAGPRLRIIASVAPDSNMPAELIKGADAVSLVSKKAKPSTPVTKTTMKKFKDIPWGIHLKNIAGTEALSLVKEGCDFLIFPADTPVSAIPSDDDTGKIIELESSLDDGLIRAVNNLPVDAVLLTDSFEEDGALVWHRLMIFQHMTNLLSKPVIIHVPPDAAESDIKALWEAGADAVIAEADPGTPNGIKNLRKLIDGLPARTSPKKGSSEALLPYPREAKTAEPEPEEEEDWE